MIITKIENLLVDRFVREDGTELVLPPDGGNGTIGTIATQEWVKDNVGGGSIDTSNLLEWDPQDRYIYDLGIGSWTTGSTTWYEDEECSDNTAEQYVRIEPKYIAPEDEQNNTHMFIGAYSNKEYSSGLNPYNGLFINQGILTTNYGFSSIKTKTYNFGSDLYEDLVLQFPTFYTTDLNEDGVGRTETIATREWVYAQNFGGDIDTSQFVTVGATNSTSSSQVIYENKEFRNGIKIVNGDLITKDIYVKDANQNVKITLGKDSGKIETTGMVMAGSLQIFNGTEPLAYINTNGNASVYQLQVNSTADFKSTVDFEKTITTVDITASGFVTAASFLARSDRRLKENIKTYQSKKSILDLDVKEFNFIGDNKKQIGCIAQELQELFPELVVENENGYLAIAENKLVYLLLNEVKTLKARLDAKEG